MARQVRHLRRSKYGKRFVAGTRLVGKRFHIGSRNYRITHRSRDIYFGEDQYGNVKTFKKIGGKLISW